MEVFNKEHSVMNLQDEGSAFHSLLEEQEKRKKIYLNPCVITLALTLFQVICRGNNKLKFPSDQQAPRPIKVIDIIKAFYVCSHPMDYLDVQAIILAEDGKRYRMSWKGPASGSMQSGFDEEFYWSRIFVLRKTAIADWFRARLAFSRKK